MDIVKLARGEEAPIDSDCISIDSCGDGTFTLTGSLLSGEDSIAMIGVGNPHRSPESAESEGLAWAAENGVEKLYVATS